METGRGETDDEVAATVFQGQSQQATVVSGEASESDDDDTVGTYSSITTTDLVSPDSSEGPHTQSTTSEPQGSEPNRHNTLLHRKLRERNSSLRRNLAEMVRQPYQNATRDLGAVGQGLIRCQQQVQEVSSTLRRVTNELFQLEDKVDTVRHCSIIPEINIPTSGAAVPKY